MPRALSTRPIEATVIPLPTARDYTAGYKDVFWCHRPSLLDPSMTTCASEGSEPLLIVRLRLGRDLFDAHLVAKLLQRVGPFAIRG